MDNVGNGSKSHESGSKPPKTHERLYGKRLGLERHLSGGVLRTMINGKHANLPVRPIQKSRSQRPGTPDESERFESADGVSFCMGVNNVDPYPPDAGVGSRVLRLFSGNQDVY